MTTIGTNPHDRFSDRLGLRPEPAEITVRHDVPEELRGILADIGYRHGYRPISLRALLCPLFFKRPDSNNWSEYPNTDREVRDLLDECPWYEVYESAASAGAGSAQRYPA